MVKWFREKRKEKPFECRFTAEETGKFCSNVMDVVEALTSPSDTEARNVKLYALAFSGLKLRNAFLLMNRVTVIDQKGIYDLEKSCQEYFFAVHCFLPVSPLASGQWVYLSHIIPGPFSVHLGVVWA